MGFRTEFELTKSKHVVLVAAVEFFFLTSKANGKLLLSRETLRGRASAEHIYVTLFHFPKNVLTYWQHCAHLKATTGLERRYCCRQCSSLRPSELLGIQSSHVFVPNLNSTNAKIYIRLGSVVSTKLNENSV